MEIVNKIKNLIRMIKAKHKEKLLLKTKDDELIVSELSAEQDNSGVNIHKVLTTMQTQEGKEEVVQSNLEEIMEQNKLKDSLKDLEDTSVENVIEGKKEKLVEKGKIAVALHAIDDVDKRLEVTTGNLEHLTAQETAELLRTIKETPEEKKAKKIENKKIKTISEQLLRTLVRFGYVSEVDIIEMAYTLKEESSKLAIIKLCLAKIDEYDIVKKKNITAKAKNKMVYDLLKETKIELFEKWMFLKYSLLKEGLLTREECKNMMQMLKMEGKKQVKIDEKSEQKPREKGGSEYE